MSDTNNLLTALLLLGGGVFLLLFLIWIMLREIFLQLNEIMKAIAVYEIKEKT